MVQFGSLAPSRFARQPLTAPLGDARWTLAHTGSVAGALLLVPSDVEAPSFPARNERVRSHAAAWGAEFIAIRARTPWRRRQAGNVDRGPRTREQAPGKIAVATRDGRFASSRRPLCDDDECREGVGFYPLSIASEFVSE
jgi:hypothetical protein